MKINALPVKTWNKLRMNDCEAEIDFGFEEYEYKEEIPEGVCKKTLTVGYDSDEESPENLTPEMGSRPSFGKGLRTGFGGEFAGELGKSGAPLIVYEFGEGGKYEKPLYQDFTYTSKGNFGNISEFRVGAGTSATVIQFVTSKDAGEAEIFIQSRYRIEKGASLTLIQVQTLEKNCRFYNDIGGNVKEDGSFKLIQLILGGKSCAYGAFNSLEGARSRFESNLAYDLDGEDNLDMNYVADHTGPRSESNIKASGVLKGNAKKLFRGTIDFHKGCASSKGAEAEDVLIIDDSCENKTIPLILCDEEDVEGSHGATIGKPDEKQVFYLQSRGIDEGEVYRMIARSKVAFVERMIEDERTRRRISAYTGEDAE